MRGVREKKSKTGKRKNAGKFLPSKVTSCYCDIRMLRDNIERYSEAVQEYIVSYSGVNNETGESLSRSLKKIGGYKVNPDDESRNIRQQAGFAAENMEVAERRAAQRKVGKRPTAVRTDDLSGHVNDEQYDISSRVDSKGNPIPKYSEQMKFVGKTPSDATKKLLSAGYSKYRDAPGRITVPSDQFDGIKAELQCRKKSLREQIRSAEGRGDAATSAKRRQQLEECTRLDRKLKKATVSSKEAVFAKKHPKAYTAKKIVGTGMEAGWEAAKHGMKDFACASFVKNMGDLFSGEKGLDEVTLGMAKDVGGAAVASYATASTAAMITGFSRNAANECVRKLASANIAAYAATATVEASKIMYGLCTGSLSGPEAVAQVGRTVVGMATAYVYGAIGQAIPPIPVVGAMVGNLVASALATGMRLVKDAIGDAAQLILDGGDAAHERRLEIEAECRKMEAYYHRCAARLKRLQEQYLDENCAFYMTAFTVMSEAYATGSIDRYIKTVNASIRRLGGVPLYEDKSEFDLLMKDRKLMMEI